MFKDDHLYFKDKPENEKEDILHSYRMKALSKLPNDVRESVLKADKGRTMLNSAVGSKRAFYDMGGSVGSSLPTGQVQQSNMNTNDAFAAKNAMTQASQQAAQTQVPPQQPAQQSTDPFASINQPKLNQSIY
jgi:hypothetical protein